MPQIAAPPGGWKAWRQRVRLALDGEVDGEWAAQAALPAPTEDGSGSEEEGAFQQVRVQPSLILCCTSGVAIVRCYGSS